MRRITDAELQESDVEYIVPDGTKLPGKVMQYLEFCTGTRVINSETGQRGTRYVIPAYMMREWLERLPSQPG